MHDLQGPGLAGQDDLPAGADHKPGRGHGQPRDGGRGVGVEGRLRAVLEGIADHRAPLGGVDGLGIAGNGGDGLVRLIGQFQIEEASPREGAEQIEGMAAAPRIDAGAVNGGADAGQHLDLAQGDFRQRLQRGVGNPFLVESLLLRCGQEQQIVAGRQQEYAVGEVGHPRNCGIHRHQVVFVGMEQMKVRVAADITAERNHG